MDYISQAKQLSEKYSITIPIDEQARYFLDSVFSAMPDNFLVGISAEVQYYKEDYWHTTQKPLWVYTQEHKYRLNEALIINNNPDYMTNHSGSIYVNMASRKPVVLSRYAARGTFSELGQVTGFWADLDIAVYNNENEHNQYELSTIFDIVLNWRKPSIAIFSGGGIQLFYLFSDLWDISTKESAMLYKDHIKQFFTGLSELLPDNILDKSVYEPDRMMRLCGFVNRKKNRNNAMAHIIYECSDRITVNEAKELSKLPEHTNNLVVYNSTRPDNTYSVNQEFLNYLNGITPPAGERHATIIKLACIGAAGGMPYDILDSVLIELSIRWYAGDQKRIDETHNIVNWALDKDNREYKGSYGNILVKYINNQFVITTDETYTEDTEQEKSKRLIDLDQPYPIPDTLSLSELRYDQDKTIDEYINTDIIDNGQPGSMLLLKTSPGSGKSHSSYNAAYKYALTNNKKVAILTKFKSIDPKEFVGDLCNDNTTYNITARNDLLIDNMPANKGYCKFTEKTNIAATKGYVIRKEICVYCPFLQTCEEKYYLSQYKKCVDYPVLIGRYAHGMIEELMKNRDLIIFDESPLDLISTPLTIGLEDCVLDDNDGNTEQHIYELFYRFFSALRSVISSNKKQSLEYLSSDNVKLSGKWFFDQLVSIMPDFSKVFDIDSKTVKYLKPLKGNDPEQWPIFFLPTLLEIMEYEYKTYYLTNAKTWNSRIILVSHTLRIYRMNPYKFPRKTKIIITDATALPDYYHIAIRDKNNSYRSLQIFDKSLTPKSNVTQFIGSEVSKTALSANNKVNRYSTIKDSIGITGQWDSNKVALFAKDIATGDLKTNRPANLSLANTILLIYDLAKLHKKSLLVVSYKTMLSENDQNDIDEYALLKQWILDSKILPKENLRWFGDLRGRNDFKGINAVMAIGTPKMQEMELLIQCQVWNYSDIMPVVWDNAKQISPYVGYKDPYTGKGKGYEYTGYADIRLQNHYDNYVTSELRQCMDRIRANTSDNTKFIYLFTAYPCADHVDTIRFFETSPAYIRACQLADNIVDNKPGHLSEQKTILTNIMEYANCSYSTALRLWKYVLENDVIRSTGEKYASKIKSVKVKNSEVYTTEQYYKDTKTKAKEFILSIDPGLKKSVRQLFTLVNDNGIDIGLSSITLLIKDLRENRIDS
jgi:hypothetical protein